MAKKKTSKKKIFKKSGKAAAAKRARRQKKVNAAQYNPVAVDRSAYPNYSLLGAIKFQLFCSELLGKETDVKTSQVYGVQGQTQLGIDIKAIRRDETGIDVGQCKAFDIIEAPQIEAASKEFLDHWESHWREKNVKRFVLFVGCSLTSTELQEQVDLERKKFSKYGIVYEAWSNAIISQKIQPHRTIAQKFLDGPWPEWLCGKAIATERIETLNVDQNRHVVGALISQIENLAADQSETQLKNWKELFKRGNGKEVLKNLEAFKADRQKWDHLPSKSKAKLLRFQSRLLLSSSPDSKETITKLSIDATALDEGNRDLSLEALIAGQLEKNHLRAIEILEDAQQADEFTLKAAFLIESGEYSKAKETLEKVSDQHNSEKYRLCAYLHLLDREFDAGLEVLKKIPKESSDLPSIQAVKGKLHFYKAYSPGLLAELPISYPLPVSPSILQSVPEAHASLREAEGIFSSLDDTYNGENKEEFSLWYFACLCLSPGKRELAKDFANSLIPSMYSNSVFISWMMIARLTTALDNAAEKLDSFLKENPSDIFAVTSRLLMYTAKDEYNLAKKLLALSRSAFLPAHKDKLDHWTAEMNIRKSMTITAIKRVRSQANSAPLKALLIERWFEIKSNDSDILSFGKKAEEFESDASFTLFITEIAHKQKNWQFVIDRSSYLFRAFPNQNTMELICSACVGAGRFDLLVQYANSYPSLVGGNIRQMRADAEKMLGNLSAAISLADEDLQAKKSERSFMYLSNLLISKGDFHSLKSKVDEYKDKVLLSVENLVFLSSWLSMDFPDSARDLLKPTLKMKITDELVPAVLSVAFELGMEDLTSELILRVQMIAKSNSKIFQAMDIDQVTDLMAARRDSFTENYRKFHRGEVPAHFFSAKHGFTLANYILANLKANESENSYLRKAPIYGRYGGRPLVRPDISKFESVCLDVTSLLYLHYFDALSALENTFEVVTLPHNSLLFLAQTRKKLRPGQASRVEAREKLIAYCDAGKIKTFPKVTTDIRLSKELQVQLGANFSSYADFAKAHGANLIVFDPVEKRASLPLAKSFAFMKDQVFGCGNVFDFAVEKTHFSELEKQAIARGLGIYAKSRVPEQLEKSKPVVFASGVGELLQSAGLLQKVIDIFDCWMFEDEVESLKAEARAYRSSEELDSSIQKLSKLLKDGIDNGKYKLLPFSPPSEEGQNDPEAELLTSLLSVSKKESDLVISDDRYINSFRTVGEVQLATFVELLLLMKEKDSIGENLFWDILLRLRASNVRFIQPIRDEILRSLPGPGEKIRETANLRVLRKYLFSCFKDRDAIDSPPFSKPPAFEHGEMSFYITGMKPVISAMSAIWETEAEESEKRGRCELLLDSLFLDNASLAAIIRRPETIDNHLDLYCHTVISFFVEVMSTRTKNRAAFLQWVEHRLLLPIADMNPHAVSRVADDLIETIDGVLASTPQKHLNVARVIYGELYQDLPEAIKDYINEKESFLEKIGVSVSEVIFIEGHRFNADEFFRAIQESYTGIEGSIQSVESEARMKIVRSEQDILCYIEDQGKSSDKKILSSPHVSLCDPNFENVERFLRLKGGRLDLSSKDLVAVVDQFKNEEDPLKKVEIWNSLAEQSYAVHLESLRDTLKDQNLSFSEIVPDLMVLAKFLRIGEPQELFANPVDLKFTQLRSDLGDIEGVRRLAGTPIDLSLMLNEIVGALDAKGIRELIKIFLRECRSPIGFFHTIRLLSCERVRKNAAYRRLRKNLVIKVVSKDFFLKTNAFLAVVHWVETNLQTSGQYRALNSRNRTLLAWVIAHTTYCQFSDFQIDPDWISKEFPKAETRFSSLLFSRDEMLNDSSYPKSITEHSLISNGLVYGLNGEVPLSETEIKSLKEMCYSPGDSPSLKISLFKSVEEQSNHLGTFLHRNPGDCFNELVGESDRLNSISTALDLLSQKAANSPNLWLVLEIIFGKSHLPLVVRSKFFERVKEINFADMVKDDLTAALLVFRYVCIQAANEFSDELNKRLKEEANRIVQHVAKQSDGKRRDGLFDSDRHIHIFLEALVKLGIQSQRASDNVKSFCDSIKELSREDSRILLDFNAYVEKMFWDFPIELRIHLGSLVVFARSA